MSHYEHYGSEELIMRILFVILLWGAMAFTLPQ